MFADFGVVVPVWLWWWQLIEAKSVTIARLMEIAPVGTVDPTPFLYNSTMYAMAGMLSVALVSNALLRPVHPKFHM